MRWLVSLAPAWAIAACSLVVDTKGLANGPEAEAADAATTGADSSATNDGSAPPSDGSVPPRDPVPIASWPFDEGSGTEIHDRSGRGHDGRAVGGRWVADRKGNPASAYELDGNNDHVLVPGSREFDRPAGATLTLMAWMKRGGALDHAMFVSVNFGAKDAAFGLEMRRADRFVYFDGVDHIPEADVTVTIGSWHHYAAAVTGPNVKTYFDGKPVGMTTSANNAERTATDVMLGGSSWGSRVQGALDDVKIFDRALSDADVAAEAAR